MLKPSDVRLCRLVSNGYFPSELPPPFTSAVYGKNATKFSRKWNGKKIRQNFRTKAESYSVPRYGHARRKLSIVNPINQLHVSDLIATNWSAIRKRLKRTNISEFDPKIVVKGPARAVTGVDFDAVARRQTEILASYGRIIRTDIARFYPSIYTHSIAWAILGKEYCKQNHHTPAFKESFADYLDKAVSSGQEGQTIGIPIGPDTSRIISELIAVEIEEIARQSVGDWDERGVRYVDDLIIGLHDEESEARILSTLSAALYDYELEINAEKTTIHGLGRPHPPEWAHYIRNFELNPKARMQRDDLDSFFEQAFYLADANPKDNVLLFACKRAASFQIDDSNVAHFVRLLLYAARRAPSCLKFVAEYLASINSSVQLPTSEIEAYILKQLPRKSEAIHTEEVAWLLFWAREIGLKLPEEALSYAINLRSSVVALVALDLNNKGLISGNLDTTFWKTFATKEGLKSEMWLVAYEATKKGWWPTSQSEDFITSHEYFGDLHRADVEFYDPSEKAKKQRKVTFVSTPVISIGAGGWSGYPS